MKITNKEIPKGRFLPKEPVTQKKNISQNKGKESENSYQKLKRSQRDRHTKIYI